MVSIHERDRQTDRQSDGRTDERTDGHRPTAKTALTHGIASRGKNRIAAAEHADINTDSRRKMKKKTVVFSFSFYYG